MQMRALLGLGFLVTTALGEVVALGADFKFQHHFIDRTLPVRDNSKGDHGLTALVDIDRDGHLDSVLGGRPFSPGQLYWFEYRGRYCDFYNAASRQKNQSSCKGYLFTRPKLPAQ